MSDNKSGITVKIGAGSSIALFLVLLALKLTGALQISWWLVTLPLWLGIAIFILLSLVSITIFGICAAVFAILVAKESRNHAKVRSGSSWGR